MKESIPVTYGEVLGRAETDNFIVTETKHLPNYKIPPHAHRSTSLACVLNGSFIEAFSFRDFDCVPQTILYKPAGEVHSNHYHSSGSHCLLIEIKNRQIEKLGQLDKTFRENVRLIKAGENFAIVRKIYREITAPDDLSELAVEGLSLELLTQFSRRLIGKSNLYDPGWLRKAKDYIHANFNQKVSLSIVAKEVGTHPSHLARVFRQNFHSSIGDYIRRLRLDFAADQLVNTNKPLAEISAEAGFYDQSHFTNLFKECYGVTPANYRTGAQ